MIFIGTIAFTKKAKTVNLIMVTQGSKLNDRKYIIQPSTVQIFASP